MKCSTTFKHELQKRLNNVKLTLITCGYVKVDDVTWDVKTHSNITRKDVRKVAKIKLIYFKKNANGNWELAGHFTRRMDISDVGQIPSFSVVRVTRGPRGINGAQGHPET